jgi:hypothetical protein
VRYYRCVQCGRVMRGSASSNAIRPRCSSCEGGSASAGATVRWWIVALGFGFWLGYACVVGR